MAASTERTNWRTFGWEGITLEVPQDWHLGKVTGDAKSGYARLDDSHMARIELEWRAGTGLHPVSQIVGKYLANLQKEARQKSSPFEAERHLDLFREQGAQEGRDYETFRWIADYRAHNLARRCPHCGRIVLVRVLARQGEHLDDLIRSVLGSLRDHAEAGRHTWAIYDLECAVPETFQLLERSLKSGNIRLAFHEPKRKPEHTLQVEYVALAGMLLGRVSLIQWFESFFSRWLRDFQISDEPAHIYGHPGVQVHGRPRFRWPQALLSMPFFRRKARRFMRAWAWHCPPSNKLFVVRAVSRDASDPLFQEMPIEVVCHQAQAASDPRGDA